jgi:PPE-repeat protein
MDPNIAENMPDVPGELNALTINELLVSAAGAKLSGTGDFTFDNSDLATFDGVPAPTGEANLELSGANGLMDKLIQMGLMSDSDAMGARMMMGMLAVPGEGEDTLKSKLEINGEGQIMANGQRIK